MQQLEAMEIVGAAASIAELAVFSAKCIQLGQSLLHSFVDAPAELQQVVEKLSQINEYIRQLQLLCDDISFSQMDDLFPQIHRDFLVLGFKRNASSLEGLRNKLKADCRTLGERLRWAMIERSRAKVVVAELNSLEKDLDIILSLITAQVRPTAINA
jgi:hypothetical protein